MRRNWQIDIDQWLSGLVYMLAAVFLALLIYYEVRVGWTRLPW